MAGTVLTWQIIYCHRGVVALKLVKGEAGAVDAACDILDAGGDVYRAEIAGTLTVLQAPQLRTSKKALLTGLSGKHPALCLQRAGNRRRFALGSSP